MAVQALAKALSDSDTENQEYTFIVRENMRGWLAPYVYGPCKLVEVSEPTHSAAKSVFHKVKAAFGKIAPLRIVWHKLHGKMAQIPVSDGYVESHQFDLVHFPTQNAFATELPSIYQPHDLQHLHCPQFFSKTDLVHRERLYRTFCYRASYICVQTEWTRQDVIENYHIPPDKVVVIPWGSVFEAYRSPSPEETRATIERYRLPTRFFFYPARTWPHKNHEIIFRALHILKNQNGIEPHVYFCGSSTEPRLVLDKLAQDLGISEQVHFLGFVTPEELQAIYRTATAMIFPSRFEGFGLPILEAFHARLPVLCSNATALPEVASDGALYFDPDSPDELSCLMKNILDKPELRQELISKGTLVLSRYSFKDMAANFQELYAMLSSSHL
jgi:glycosyltransferase involved in cell wall biosynthesis